KSIDKEAAKFIRETHNNYFSRHVIVRTIVQILLIGLAIAFGLFLKELLILLESYFIGSGGIQFFSYIPLFPLAMIGGALLQLSLKALGMQQLVHPKTMNFVSDFALELLIIAAVSTISLVAISNNLGPFILLALAGIVWNISAFLVLAPRLMGRKMWFRRGIGDYGQSMGMTATGLLLMHAADPHNRSHAVERFGYKQLLFEPIVGGGLFTASSMIIIYDFGLVSLLLISVVVLVVWLIVGYYAFARHTK
ncbi:sodium:glutamate symporter, partial [Candidatus Saccharibacteria bacterium]|nr:sodium:glutamate symporter [Candidatus Saccharibacteria bacterium]